jgi:hypothetical protein
MDVGSSANHFSGTFVAASYMVVTFKFGLCICYRGDAVCMSVVCTIPALIC